jgi:hypothetical protein
LSVAVADCAAQTLANAAVTIPSKARPAARRRVPGIPEIRPYKALLIIASPLNCLICENDYSGSIAWDKPKNAAQCRNNESTNLSEAQLLHFDCFGVASKYLFDCELPWIRFNV